jgi:hypothetical protein
MKNRFEIEKYGFHNYDDFFCLRPPWLLIAALIYLCRSLVGIAMSGLAGGVPPGLGDVVDTDMLWAGCVAALPALLLLYAFGARVEGAPAFVRWIWGHGRALVAVSVAMHIAVAAAQLGVEPRSWLGSSLAEKAVVLADLAVVVYVFSSARVKQTFLDFPG